MIPAITSGVMKMQAGPPNQGPGEGGQPRGGHRVRTRSEGAQRLAQQVWTGPRQGAGGSAALCRGLAGRTGRNFKGPTPSGARSQTSGPWTTRSGPGCVLLGPYKFCLALI